MRAVVINPARIIGENSRSVYPGEILDGAEAGELVAAGNAEVIPDAVELPEASVEPTEASVSESDAEGSEAPAEAEAEITPSDSGAVTEDVTEATPTEAFLEANRLTVSKSFNKESAD